MTDTPDSSPKELPGDLRLQVAILLGSTLLVALCSIIYELVIGTVSSYLLGNSVVQFSITIGIYMSAMGLGSYLSRFIKKNLLEAFFWVELGVGAVGGTCAALLFGVFTFSPYFRPMMWLVTIVIGTLVGLEIPLLTRYIRRYAQLRDAIADVLSWDYVGALLGSIAFPLFLLPTFGLLDSAALVGMLNVSVAAAGIWYFRDRMANPKRLIAATVAVAVGLVTLFFTSGAYQRLLDSHLYTDEVVYRDQTPYQKITMTGWKGDFRLYLNGNIQFSSVDEHRYHEALVHPAMAAARDPRDILLLGAGDGLALRQLQKYPKDQIDTMTVVDLDPAMTELGRTHPILERLNGRAFEDPRVETHHDDAMNYLRETDETYDVIISDLPDPNNESLAKLYTVSFYRLVRAHLRPGGVFVAQSTSPFFARKAFWSIHRTIEEAFCPDGDADADDQPRCADPEDARGSSRVVPYHAWVPTFGDWGFNIAAREPLHPAGWRVRVPTEYLDDRVMQQMFTFPKDQGEMEVQANRLMDPALLHYYMEGWQHYFQ